MVRNVHADNCYTAQLLIIASSPTLRDSFLSSRFFHRIIVYEAYLLPLTDTGPRQNTIHPTNGPHLLSSRMQRVNSSANGSTIAVNNGESGKAIAADDTYESLGNKKVHEWISQRSATSPPGDDQESIIFSVDQTASKVGTAGRDTQIPEERKEADGEIIEELSVPEPKIAELASDLLKHSTISRDQSSARKHSAEKLSVLAKPANNLIQGLDVKVVLLRFLHEMSTY